MPNSKIMWDDWMPKVDLDIPAKLTLLGILWFHLVHPTEFPQWPFFRGGQWINTFFCLKQKEIGGSILSKKNTLKYGQNNTLSPPHWVLWNWSRVQYQAHPITWRFHRPHIMWLCYHNWAMWLLLTLTRFKPHFDIFLPISL